MIGPTTLTSLGALALLGGIATAHPGEIDPHRSPEQLHRAAKRIASGFKCAGAAQAGLAKRIAKRGLQAEDVRRHRKRWEPTYDKIQNTTCVMAPEVMEGPFWISEIMMRQDITDGQAGLPLLLDIGVLDVNTCEPLANVGVDIWTVNATGHYSGFSSNEGGGGGGGPGGPGRGPPGRGPPGRGPPGRGPPGEHDHAPEPYDLVMEELTAPSPTDGEAGAAASPSATKKPNGGMKEPDLEERFLRGFWPTNPAGVVELRTNYPGWYSGRNPHIHLKVHTHWKAEDGHLSGSRVAHTGQIFFEDGLSDLVYKWGVYAERPGSEARRRNGDDRTFDEAAQNGFDPTVHVTWVDEDDIGAGLIGYLTVGVDGEAAGKVAEEAGLVIQA